jgi:hypothetical protein
VGIPVEKEATLKDPGVDGMVILRLIMRNLDVGMEWIDLAQSKAGSRTFKRGNETSSFIKWGEFVDYLLASEEWLYSMHLVSK